MYGIPNLKLSKTVVLDRIDRMEQEGIKFVTSTEIGKDYPVLKLDAGIRRDSAVHRLTSERTINVPGKDLTEWRRQSVFDRFDQEPAG